MKREDVKVALVTSEAEAWTFDAPTWEEGTTRALRAAQDIEDRADAPVLRIFIRTDDGIEEYRGPVHLRRVVEERRRRAARKGNQ
jgi:hypothetical protein